MNEETTRKFKKRLETLRDEILKVINWKESASEAGEAMDEIDQANELIEKEMGFVMSFNMRNNLNEVQEALDRISNKKFGACANCGAEIALKRLEILPFARFCTTCQEKVEARAR